LGGDRVGYADNHFGILGVIRMKNVQTWPDHKSRNRINVDERIAFNRKVAGVAALVEGSLFLICGGLAGLALTALANAPGALLIILAAVVAVMVGIGLGLLSGGWAYLSSNGTRGKVTLIVSSIVAAVLLGLGLAMDVAMIGGPSTNQAMGVRMVLEFVLLGGAVVVLFALFERPKE
jgi:hypothetical protein